MPKERVGAQVIAILMSARRFRSSMATLSNAMVRICASWVEASLMSAAMMRRSSAGVPGATRKLARLAKFRLQEMIEGKKLRIEAMRKDRFGRPLVNVYLPNGREVRRQLIRKGFAREWRKGNRIDWCL